jgi:LAS superfamily LD-carboxypeptidase LdcB
VLFLVENSTHLPIFLFSAGCARAEELSKSNLVDKNNLYIIEPWIDSASSKTKIENAIKNGVPAANVYAGPGAGRGTGIAGASKTPSNIDHWGSLKYVGSLKASLAAKTYYKTKTQEGNNQNGGGAVIYTNVGNTAAGVPPGYEKFGVARTTTRKGASKADGPNGSIPYENLRKVNRSYTGAGGRAIYGSGYLHPEAAVGWELFLDFCAEQGVLFEITPGGGWYRDYDNQIRLFDLYGASRAATPGHSNHGWGIAIDIRDLCNQTEAAAKQLGVSATNPKANAAVRNTDLYRFFATNAPKFGWYNPHLLCDNKGSDETWHWEYYGFSTLTSAQRNEMLKTFAETPRKSPLTKK